MSFRNIVAAMLAEDTHALLTPQNGNGSQRESAHKGISLDQMYAALARDMGEYLRAIRDLRDEVAELRRRNEQACTWLAQLSEDLRLALRPDAADVRQLQAMKRSAMGSAGSGAEAHRPESALLSSGFGATPTGRAEDI